MSEELTNEIIEAVKSNIKKRTNIHRREKTLIKKYKGYSYYQVKGNDGYWRNFIYDLERELIITKKEASLVYNNIDIADEKCKNIIDKETKDWNGN